MPPERKAAPAAQRRAACGPADGPAGRTALQRQRQPQQQQNGLLDVLELVLQHSDLLRGIEAQDFCRLVETSTVVAAAALQLCPGQLEAVVCPEFPDAAEEAAPWIARHGQSLRSLTLDLADPSWSSDTELYEDSGQAGAILVAALEDAAAQQPADQLAAAAAAGTAVPGLLQRLQTLKLWALPVTAADVLQLAGRQLTELQIGLIVPEELSNVGDDDSDDDDYLVYHRRNHIEDEERMAAAVAALPGLRRLDVGYYGPGCITDPALLPALAGSSSLTQLKVRELADTDLMQHLPQQLQELVIEEILDGPDADDPQQGPWLQLRHLTALTRLELGECQRGRDWLSSDDELPPSLEVLQLVKVHSCRPLLALPRLRQLNITAQQQPAAKLSKLSMLSALTSIKLGSQVGSILE